MQKLITVTIDVEKLQEDSKGAFTLTEVEEINVLLEEGWGIEEWEFITGEKEISKAVLLVVLNDGPGEDQFDAIYNMEDESEGGEEEDYITNEAEDDGEEEEANTYPATR